ncbi:MAG: hypothetical protein V7K48_27430 [Nostoc sp.]|uniref:hypothetical protein n=1 Tax=Nostoc sp. TaxID=1180 RepID=UPI002FF65EFE
MLFLKICRQRELNQQIQEVAGNGFADLQEKIINPAYAATLSLANFDQGIVAVSAGQGKAGNVVIQTPNFLTRNILKQSGKLLKNLR